MIALDDIFKKRLEEQIKIGEIPHHLFKYRSIDSPCLRGLANHTLYFSNLDSFNDPFEGKVFFSKKLLEDTLRRIKVNVTPKNMDLLTREMDEKVKQTQSAQSVCCLSNTDDDILLWSHYADWHKGVCLKFDLTRDASFFLQFSPSPMTQQWIPPIT